MGKISDILIELEEQEDHIAELREHNEELLGMIHNLEHKHAMLSMENARLSGIIREQDMWKDTIRSIVRDWDLEEYAELFPEEANG